MVAFLSDGKAQLASAIRLLDAVEANLDRRERVVDRRADLADNRDDGNADESGDQAVLNCGGTRFTLDEPGEKILHNSYSQWVDTLG